MKRLYTKEYGKDLKIKGVILPFKLCLEILESTSLFVILAPHDKNFIQHIVDINYYNRFGCPDCDCDIDYFIEELCNKYINKLTKRTIKKNKNNHRNILREVVRIFKLTQKEVKWEK